MHGSSKLRIVASSSCDQNLSVQVLNSTSGVPDARADSQPIADVVAELAGNVSWTQARDSLPQNVLSLTPNGVFKKRQQGVISY